MSFLFKHVFFKPIYIYYTLTLESIEEKSFKIERKFSLLLYSRFFVQDRYLYFFYDRGEEKRKGELDFK